MDEQHTHHQNVCGRCRKHCCGKGGASHHSLGGGLWFIGWLFTIGFLHLSFWHGVIGIIVWPYFLGTHFAM